MKKRTLILLAALLMLISVFPASPAVAADVSDYPIYFTTINTAGVNNNPEYYPDFTVGNSDLLVQAVSTYHWNYGQGSTPGTISIYDWDDNLLGTWNAAGRGGQGGAQNVYWDIFPNITLKAGQQYYIVDSDPETWSCNSVSGNQGFVEIRGREAAAAPAPAAGIAVTINGSAIQWTDAIPFADANNRTMVPLRAVGEALGLQVDWNGASQEASFTDGVRTIFFPINSKYYRMETGEYGSMDTAAVVVNQRTFAPIRYLAEYFGYSVDWDGSTRTVVVTGGQSTPAGTGGQSTSGRSWVLTDTKVSPAEETVYPEIYIYSYEGQKSGKEWLKYSYRWSYGKEYTNADLYFGCSMPPASIPAGSAVSFEITYRMVGLDGWTYSGFYSAPTGSCYVRTMGRKCYDADDHDALWPGEENTTYLAADVDVTRTFTGNMPDDTATGTAEIVFVCPAGNVTWTYILQDS